MQVQNVAQTIYSQLGGTRFTVMTGANSFLGTKGGLSFRLPSNGRYQGRTVNYVRVTLQNDDTYTVEVSFVRGRNETSVEHRGGVYADALQSAIKALTGLELGLTRVH